MDTFSKRVWGLLGNGGLVLSILGAGLALLQAFAGLSPATPVWVA